MFRRRGLKGASRKWSNRSSLSLRRRKPPFDLLAGTPQGAPAVFSTPPNHPTTKSYLFSYYCACQGFLSRLLSSLGIYEKVVSFWFDCLSQGMEVLRGAPSQPRDRRDVLWQPF